MADQKCMAILLELILSTIACIQLHVTMLIEAIREYKALKAATQSKENFFINGAKFIDPAIVWTISYY